MHGDDHDQTTTYLSFQKISLIEQIARLIKQDMPDLAWVFYGSVAYGALRPESDLDILVLLNSLEGGPQRLSLKSTDGREVSAYVLTPTMLEEDGMSSAYGGYFIGKLANPHICHGMELEAVQRLHKAIGMFLGSRAYQARNHKHLPLVHITVDQVVADCLLGFISWCPWVAYYLVRYHGKPHVWDFFRQTYPEALEAAGMVTSRNGLYSYRPPKADTSSPYFDELAKARFWALGAKFHPSMESFPDIYVEKAKKSADALEVLGNVENMLLHLQAAQVSPSTV